MGSKSLHVLFPDRVTEMVLSAAEAKGCLTSSYVRQAVYAALRADGFDPTGVPRSSGETWVVSGHELPVEYRDSQPFDPAKHYRLAPVDVIESLNGRERVIRTYPVILKEEDVG